MKQETCPVCKGKKTLGSVKTVRLTVRKGVIREASEQPNDNTCPHCEGLGTINAPPFGDGSNMKMSKEKVSQLASAGTLMRNIDTPEFVQVVATEAARILLSDPDVETFVDYWGDANRGANLGQYIEQIAEYAEAVAMEQYGSLGDRVRMAPRPNKHVEPQMELNDGHFHEAIHTIHVLRDTFYNHVVECAAIDLTPELKEAALKAADGLNDLYQKVGLYDHKRMEKKEGK